MNLDSYTRLNPYSDDEKHGDRETREGDHRLAIACGVVAALMITGAWAWSRV